MTPTCGYCGKNLHEQSDSEYHSDRPANRSRVDIPSGRYGYGGDGRFCTLRCGYRYAVRALGGAVAPELDLDRTASCGCTVRRIRGSGHRPECYYSSPDPGREQQRRLAAKVAEMTGRPLDPGQPPEQFRGGSGA